MVVQDLSRQQLNELKESYAQQLKQDGISWGELSEAHEIPDEIIFEHTMVSPLHLMISFGGKINANSSQINKSRKKCS